MEFAFRASEGVWVATELVTNAQFARFSTDHRGESKKPAVGLPLASAKGYAAWLSAYEVDKGTLPAGASFRLPEASELSTDSSSEWLQSSSESADASMRGFRMVLETGEATAAAPGFPALAVGAGLLGVGLLAIAAVCARRKESPVAINERAPTPAGPIRVPSGDDAAGYDLVIGAPEPAKEVMALASSPAEVDMRNSSIVTTILDARKRAAEQRAAEAIAPPPKLPKSRPVKPAVRPKTNEPLPEDTWDQLVAAAHAVPPKIELPEGADPKVVDDETRDDFELPRHTKVKRNKSTVTSLNALDDKTLNNLISGEDFDEFVNSID